jgi:DNA polymerase-4/protein ImuB
MKIRTSEHAVCVWIPLFPLRCEEARQPELSGRPLGLLAPDDTKRLWQVSPLARRAGVQPGMTVSRAIGLCPALTLLKPDPVHYDEQFTRLLIVLHDVSPVVEPAGLGRAFVGADGLEGLYGSPERQLELVQLLIGDFGLRISSVSINSAIRNPQSAIRLGWGRGKFIASVAASRAKPGQPIVVAGAEEQRFLASQPIAVLPLDPDTHRRLQRLGLQTLGDMAALPEDALASQFGDTGRKLWRLAAGKITEPVRGHEFPEPIVAGLDFPAPIADREILAQTLARLVERALASPRRTGWRIVAVRARAALEQGGSWLTEVILKDPSADRDHIVAPLKVRIEHAPPTGAVERLSVEFIEFAPGTAELQLFARDANAAARAGRRRALRSAAQAIKTRFKRSLLYRIVEVQPWSRLPERRYALIDYEP